LTWECDPEHWNTLQNQFPELAQKTGNPFDILEGLEPKARRRIDAFARVQIVEAHPEWVNAALLEMAMEEKELFLSSESVKPFEGINDLSSLATVLESEQELIGYTQDNTVYYRFLVQQKGESKEILSFKAALKEGVLEKLSASQETEALVAAIVDACPQEYKDKAYAYRFAPFIAQYKDNPPQGELIKQFVVEKKEKTITRSDPSFISIGEVLALKQGECSEVKADTKEGAYVYRFLDRKVDTTLPLDKLMQSQELLSKEARCRYFNQLLNRFRDA
jgi:hypothetical protein